jgi:hypothetical protein
MLLTYDAFCIIVSTNQEPLTHINFKIACIMRSVDKSRPLNSQLKTNRNDQQYAFYVQCSFGMMGVLV